jgi:2-oxoglutarate dehydrogenase E1 component
MVTTNRLPDSANLAWVEDLYAQYTRDPAAVPEVWQEYFRNLENYNANGSANGRANGAVQLGPSFHAASIFNPAATNGAAGAATVHPARDAASRDSASQSTPARSTPRQRTPLAASGGSSQVAHRAANHYLAEADIDPARVRQAYAQAPRPLVRPSPATEAEVAALQDRVDQLIRSHRVRGHMVAQIDPLGLPREYPPEIDPEYYGFGPEDLDRRFSCETIHEGGPLPLSEIVTRLRETYCRAIGVQFMHIDDLPVRNWLQQRMEATQNRLEIKREDQLRILTRLTDATIFEEFVRRKFVGAKSFSLAGAESLIPLLDLAIEKSSEQGVDEIVMGMAHRGRLNVLANIIGKSPRAIFREFEDSDPDQFIGRGDVKYHLGYQRRWKTSAGREVYLSLCFNPSHLEFVNPVVLGRVRARQDRRRVRHERRHSGRERVMALLIHGDAAFAGEGIVQETLNLSQLDGYRVGGTLHVVVNNQIGFTTSPRQGRSSPYATDIAKMLQIPIFHVNGEDPEAVAQVVELALEFRRRFGRDVVIDMYCYRRLGHNETDEPSFTQPRMYRAIGQKPSVRESYTRHLLKLGQVTQEEADAIAEERREYLEKELTEARSENYALPKDTLSGTWDGYMGGADSEAPQVSTAVPRAKLVELLKTQIAIPAGFRPNPKMKRILDARAKMAEGAQPLDWAGGELLAFASLADEGHRIRLSGQDVERGTFSHRYATLHDFMTGRDYFPLQHVSPDQAPVGIYNSPLSEAGVLGFDYGYSQDCPEGLIMWEAQFGDFWNAAQVIVDQFIASGEDKWHRLSGLTMLLPHGFEGSGPEHSSARLERFLNLAADDNIQVVYPTTPAQQFHLLRRQVLRPWRKPLVVMSPKSLLRHLEAVSTLEELAEGEFQRIIPDTSGKSGADIKRVLLCSGKIYYELDRAREEKERNDVAIIRIEQLYPLSNEAIEAALAPYDDGTPVVWVQEEPRNMGAWPHWRIKFCDNLFNRFPFGAVTRLASASPATGSSSSHKREQEKLITAAFEGCHGDIGNYVECVSAAPNLK